MKNKLNKEFEDVAWSQMQKMLDQEMPVAEKKRRRGVLWLFLLSGIIALSGAFIYWGNKKENAEKAQIMQTTNKELIVDNKELNTPINSINNSNLKTENDKSIANLENKNNKIEQQIIIKSSGLNKDESKMNGASVGRATVTSTSVTRATVKVAPTPPQYVGENKDISTNEGAISGATLTQELILPLTINKLGEIKSSESSELVLGKINAPIVRKNIIKNKLNTKTHLSLILGVHTEGGKKIDGGQLGVLTHTYLNNRWSIFAGLNYRKTTVQVDSSTDGVVGYRAASTPTTTTNFSPQGLLLIPVKKIILNQLNYLELPVGFNYAFNKKMSFSLGIKTAYLLTTNVRISADSSVFFLKEMSQKSSYNLDQSLSNSIAQLGVQRWDFAAIGGINYGLSKRFQLGLGYDFGLNSVVKRANWTAYNRFLGFNVVYLLK